MKLRIVICDDDPLIHENVKDICDSYVRIEDIAFISCCSVKELLNLKVEYQAVFMDIDMPEIDGIEGIKILQSKGIKKPVILLTSKRERFKDGYIIGAKRFITKPIDKDELFEALDYLFFSMIGSDYITVNYMGKSIKIMQRNIDYIESRGNYRKLYSGEKVYECRYSMKELNNMFDERLFLMVHKGYIVNMSKIKLIGDGWLCMQNDSKLPIARRKSNEVIQALVSFDKRNN